MLGPARSPYLRAPARPTWRGSPKRVLLRLLLVLALGLPGWWLVAEASRPLADAGALRQGIYRAHDGIWLPLKGQLWTALWPAALWFYGISGLLLTLGLIGFLLDRSLYRGAHLALSRRLVRRPAVHPFLIKAHAWSKGSRFRQRQIELVAEHELERARERVGGLFDPAGRHPRGAQIAVRRLTLLRVALLQSRPSDSAEQLAAVVLLMRAWQLTPELTEPELRARLAASAAALAGASDMDDPCSLNALLGELALLAGDEPGATLFYDLAAAVQARRRRMDGLRRTLESRLRESYERWGSRRGGDATALELAGGAELAGWISIAVARAADLPELAFGWLASVEALAFTADAFDLRREPHGQDALVAAARALLRGHDGRQVPSELQLRAIAGLRAGDRPRLGAEAALLDEHERAWLDEEAGLAALAAGSIALNGRAWEPGQGSEHP